MCLGVSVNRISTKVETKGFVQYATDIDIFSTNFFKQPVDKYEGKAKHFPW